MHDINVILADLPGLGRVRLCECNSVHLCIGPVTINLEKTAFQQITDLMASARERLAKIKESPENESGNVQAFRSIQIRMTH